MISLKKFRGDRLKGLETADDCGNVEEEKRWNLQADILLLFTRSNSNNKKTSAHLAFIKAFYKYSVQGVIHKFSKTVKNSEVRVCICHKN